MARPVGVALGRNRLFKGLARLFELVAQGKEHFSLEDFREGVYFLLKNGILSKATSLGNTPRYRLTSEGRAAVSDIKSIAHLTAAKTLLELQRQDQSLQRRIKLYRKILKDTAP